MTIIYQHICLLSGVIKNSLDKELLFKEYKVLIFNWQVIPRHVFVQPLLSFHHKIPLSSGFVYHSILVLAYDCSGSQTILQRLRKV